MSRPSWVEYLEAWVGEAATDVLRRRYAALGHAGGGQMAEFGMHLITAPSAQEVVQ